MIKLNQGVSAPIAIVIIIVLATILVGGVLAYQYWWAPETIPPEIEGPKDETADWKVYSNPAVDFTLKYPPDWEIKEEYQYKSAACQMDPSCEGVRYIFLNKVDDPRPANTGESEKFGIVINMPQCTGVQHDDLPGNNWICLFDEDPLTPKIYENIRDSFQIMDETADWKTYRNEEYGFEIKYPEGTRVEEQKGLWENKYNYTDIGFSLPYTQGTKLSQKSLRILIREKVTPDYCRGLVKWKGITKINGVDFYYIPGFKWDRAMGGLSFYASDYSTMKNSNCIGLSFRLGVRDPTGFVDPGTPIPPDPPEQDLGTEVFDQMLSTFRFIE